MTTKQASRHRKETTVTTQTETGKITPGALERLRQRMGIERAPVERPGHEAAMADAIVRYAWGIGDDNPLWTDAAYAGKTRWGGIIAPPTFLYTCGGSRAEGLPGVHALWSGDDWTFVRPVRAGERIVATFKLTDLVEKRSEFSGRMVQQIYDILYRNPEGETLAVCRRWYMRTERTTARDKGKYAAITKHRYTDAEVQEIDRAYEREHRQGATPRYWEDVQVGEDLTPVVKGPLTVTNVIAWMAGNGIQGNFLLAHKMAHDFWKRNPASRVSDPETGAPDFPSAVHWSDAYARQIGAPAAYDIGGQRISFLGHLMTNWMSDDGQLKRLYVELRRFNILGDVLYCKGRVTRKWQEASQHLVECEIWAENQRAEVTAPGKAVVALPSRGAGPSA